MSGRRPPRVRTLLWPIVAFTALGVVGTALTPPLAARHPLLLIAMEARDRNLLLGRHDGRVGVAWLQRHGGGRVVAATVRAFRRAAYPMLVVFPGAVVCTLAGDAGVPPAAFGVIVVLRTIAVVLMIRFVGNVFAGPVDATIHFFDRHLLSTSLASVALMAGWVLWER